MKPSGHWSRPILAVLASLMFPFFTARTAAPVAQEAPAADFKIAFIGDQGLGTNAVAVLNLIKAEGAQAVMHSGDIDYTDNPAAWEAQVNNVLGANFPYFVSIGNHDELAWSRPNGYQHYLENRFNRLGISWVGRLGVRSSFYYQGIFFVLTAPGITNGFDEGGSDLYLRDQLAADDSVWSICSWHKNMRLMQVGGKADETGWGVYEEARKGGAIIATAHEHSYSRTHLLSSMVNQTVVSTSNILKLTKGNSFAFVSGLGGHSVRAQSLTGHWWASAYASTCLAGDQICQPNAAYGALFGVFNVDGQPNKAAFYFKDINGRVVDRFEVISYVETPLISGITPSGVVAGADAFTLTVDGAGFVNSSVARLNNMDRPTTFVSPARLAVAITAADLATAGVYALTVFNPTSGGGTSNPVNLTVSNPAPTIDSLSPALMTAGGGDFLLTVNGTGFVEGSVASWNGSNRTTTFVSPTQLTTKITAADVTTAGTYPVTVFNPTPGGGTSNSKTFTVDARPPALLTDEGTGRAIALDSVTWVREPFPVMTPDNFSLDKRTRVMLFATDIDLASVESVSAVAAQAEDSQNRVYPLGVEFVGRVPGLEWLTQVIVKLPDGLENVGEVRVSITVRGASSNKALLRIGPSGNSIP